MNIILQYFQRNYMGDNLYDFQAGNDFNIDMITMKYVYKFKIKKYIKQKAIKIKRFKDWEKILAIH